MGATTIHCIAFCLLPALWWLPFFIFLAHGFRDLFLLRVLLVTKLFLTPCIAGRCCPPTRSWPAFRTARFNLHWAYIGEAAAIGACGARLPSS